MLKLTCKGSLLSQMLKAVDAIINETILEVTYDGIHTRVVDTANVAMVDISISRKEFDSYSLDSEMTLGLPIRSLIPLCPSMEKEKCVDLECDNSKLILKFANYEYSLRMLDVKALRKTPSKPYINCSTFFTIPTSSFSEILKASKTIEKCDKVRFIVDGSTLQCLLDNDKDEKLKLTYEIQKTQAGNALYSLDYLKAFLGGIYGDEIEIKYSTDHPIFISSKFGEHGSTIEYLLAHRLE